MERKKIVFLILALAMLVSMLTGCGGSDTDSVGMNDHTDPATAPTVPEPVEPDTEEAESTYTIDPSYPDRYPSVEDDKTPAEWAQENEPEPDWYKLETDDQGNDEDAFGTLMEAFGYPWPCTKEDLIDIALTFESAHDRIDYLIPLHIMTLYGNNDLTWNEFVLYGTSYIQGNYRIQDPIGTGILDMFIVTFYLNDFGTMKFELTYTSDGSDIGYTLWSYDTYDSIS